MVDDDGLIWHRSSQFRQRSMDPDMPDEATSPDDALLKWRDQKENTALLLDFLSGRFGDPLVSLGILHIHNRNDFDALCNEAGRSWTPLDEPRSTAVAMVVQLYSEDEAFSIISKHFSHWRYDEVSRFLGLEKRTNLNAFRRFIFSKSHVDWNSDDLIKAYLFSMNFRPAFSEYLYAANGGVASLNCPIIEEAVTLYTTTRRRPLRVAWCVAGQLRGFVEAKKSWDQLGLNDCQVDTYVHTWLAIGQKEPRIYELDRCFSGDLLKALNFAVTMLGYDVVSSRYKRLFDWFLQSDVVSLTELQETYSTKNIILEDDLQGSFSSWSSIRKLYYKAAKVHEMIDASNYDLVVRIRPDKILNGAPDWRDIAAVSAKQRVLYADFPECCHATVGHVVGDQFAAGSREVMGILASTYNATLSGQLAAVGLADFVAHRNFAAALVFGGIECRCPESIEFGSLLNKTMDQATARGLLHEIPLYRDEFDNAIRNSVVSC